MNFKVTILFGLLLFLGLLWRHRKRRGKRRLGFYLSSAAMGNALLGLQSFVQPQIKHILREKLDEEADEDDAGGPEDPMAHLHRQLADVRKGKKLEQLTVFLPNKPENDEKME